jgi:ferrous iron transport protein A
MRKIIPLTDLPAGKRAKVRRLAGGRGLRARLSSLGLRPGVPVTKVSAGLLSGPVVVQLQGSQVAVGHGMARRIMVEEIEGLAS